MEVTLPWHALMERKSLVLILLALCVLFILEEEVFQFDAFNTRPASQTENLTRSRSSSNPSSPALHLRSSSGPGLRTALFTRSRFRYEGKWKEGKSAGTGSRGLESIVQTQLNDRKGDDNNNNYDNGNDKRVNGLDFRQFGERMRQGDEGGRHGLDISSEDSRDGLSDGDEASDEDERGGTRGSDVGYGPLEEEEDEEEKRRTSPFIYREEEDKLSKVEAAKAKDVRYISYYLPWEQDEHSKHFDFCRYNNCAFVNNMSLADVVVFKAANVRDHVIPNFYRPKGQRWLVYTSDPATKKYGFTRPDVVSSFNWTMTYQLDADAPRIFGRLRQQAQPERDYDKLYDNKARTAAWFVSHCPTWSKREDYVKRMQRVMDVDIFGNCGNLSCGVAHYRQNDRNLCLPMLTNEYKFYLSFENSFCPDYITEKFFKLFDGVQVIPVVRGGFDYKKYLPNGIYINSADFRSPEALARYLVDLANDKERYLEILRRKDRWSHITLPTRHCRMCEHVNTHWNDVGYHPNLRHKFNGYPLSCWSPTDL